MPDKNQGNVPQQNTGNQGNQGNQGTQRGSQNVPQQDTNRGNQSFPMRDIDRDEDVSRRNIDEDELGTDRSRGNQGGQTRR